MTTMTTTTRFALIATIAASLVISSICNMATSALATNGHDDDRKERTVVQDKKDKNVPKDFDIKAFGFDKVGNPFIDVYGKAGRTLATGEEQIYAYVVYTDDGIWAVNNHGFSHGDPEGDVGLIWHSERVIFDDPEHPKCLVGADNESESILAGKRVTLVGTGSTEAFVAQTVELVHVMDDPDETECPGSIARLVQVFDTASDEENEHRRHN